jgi:site-specific DNA-methyltransferase (adenine-specific)
MNLYYQDDYVALYHGDCLTEHREWLTADVLVTDPPYGMTLRSSRNGAFGDLTIANDETLDARDAALSAFDGPALIFGRWSEPKPKGTRMVLTWEKGEHVGMGDLALPWKPNTEEIYVIGSGFTGHRGGSVLKQNAIAGSVGQAKNGTRFHPTQKPTQLMERLIEKCPPGTVADPFAGSGATLLAAKNLGRQVIGVELEEKYCEIIAKRCAQDVFDFGAIA